jgi:hypothetical protein
MNSYFDQVQREIGAAVSGGRHLPWYRRFSHTRHARALVVVLAALVVATPAVGAVTNWFGFGTPLHVQNNGSPTVGLGRTLTPTSQLMSLRVADPQGGPPWGLRLVGTTRRDVCLQFGRVEDDQLGALGIDDSWKNDHKFHPFPKAFTGGWGLQCGTTDAAGHAFLNVQWTGIASSANPYESNSTGGCTTPKYMPAKLQRLRANDPSSWGEARNGQAPGTCPAGTSRMVFMGLLGPDATSISYQAPDGSMRTQKTSGGVGAYLVVVPLTQETCTLYFDGPKGGQGPCGDSVEGGSNSASPGPFGPVRAIHYRDGHTCSLEPPHRLYVAYQAFSKRLLPKTPTAGYLTRPGERAKFQHAMARFAASWHLSLAQLENKIQAACPAVGYVEPNEKHLTEADVTSPVTFVAASTGGDDAGATISFTARQPVSSGNSWYEVATTGPARCAADSNGPIGYGNVRAGQRLSEPIGFSADCKGTIHGVVGYMQNGGPTSAENAGSGGTPGQDGSIVVGHFTFRVH